MKKVYLLLFCLLFTQIIRTAETNHSTFQSVAFIENKGQIVNNSGEILNEVLFKTQTPGVDIYITTSGISYMFTKTETPKDLDDKKITVSAEQKFPEMPTVHWNRLDMILKNASIKKENVITENQQLTYYNYYLGHCPDGITNVHSYGKIIIKDVYPGIDWHIYTKENKSLKYDFIVHPGANASLIKIDYNGAEKITALENGNILIKTPIGEVQENNLYCFEQSSGKKISSAFSLDNKAGEIGFSFGNYDHNQTMVIDPDLVWGTYFGGSLIDFPQETMVDADGNVYVIGGAGSVNLPSTNPAAGNYYQGTHQGGNGGPISGGVDTEAFLAKFDTDGKLIWCTYYGGSTGQEGFFSMGYNSTGDIYVGGGYGHNAAIRPNPLPPPHNFPLQNVAGSYFRNPVLAQLDAETFILRFDNAGVRKWATFYGGSAADWCYDLNVDNNDNVYLIGRTQSSDLPIVNPGGGAYMSNTAVNVFIAKFNPGNQLTWSTHWGGTAIGVHTICSAVDQNDNLIIAGTTDSPDLPMYNPGGGAYFDNTLVAPGGGVIFDMFAAKFDANGVPFWSTYYGSNGQDECYAVCTDLQNNIYMTGYTGVSASPNTFPTYNPGGGAYYNGTAQSGLDLAILKFDPNGVRNWVTLYNGTSSPITVGGGINVDAIGNIYVTGSTDASDFPIVSSACGFLQSTNASQDITNGQEFILQFSPALTVKWSTYYGGIGRHNLNMDNNMSIDGLGNLYLTTLFMDQSCPTFDPGNGAYFQSANNGDYDAIILKFSPKPIAVATNSVSVCVGSNVALTASGGLFYNWSNGTTTSSMNVIPPIGNTTYSVVVTNNQCSDTAYVNVTASPYPVAAIAGPTVTCSGTNVQLSATGGNTYAWNTSANTNNITVAPTSNTTFSLVAYNGSCADTAFLNMVVNQNANAQINGSNSICIGDSVLLNAAGGTNYLWSNGSTFTSIKVGPTSTMSYSLVANLSNCPGTALITITVNQIPVALVSNDTAICEGNNLSLTSSGGSNYIWNDGALTSTNNISPGIGLSIYTVSVSNGNCIDIASVNITVNPTPVANAGIDKTIVSGGTVVLNGSSGPNYLWSPSTGLSCNTCANPIVKPETTTMYILTVTNSNGCSSSDTVMINIELLCGDLFIPNAFSPNNDGQNDVFAVKGNCFSSFHLDIFDRWGEIIFTSDNQLLGWDGTYKTKDLNSDVFVYKLIGELNDGGSITKEGSVTLIK